MILGITTLVFAGSYILHVSHVLEFVLGDGGIAEAVGQAEHAAATKHELLMAQVRAVCESARY